MKHFKQPGAIKNLICPLCGGDYCGCVDCMGRKKFTFCKSCGIEYQRKAGKALTPAVLKRIKAKLHKAGVWNKAAAIAKSAAVTD